MTEQTVRYRPLAAGEWSLIEALDASQYIERAWRKKDGAIQLIDINYFEPGFPEGLDSHQKRLKETICKEGFAIGAFDTDNEILGFCAVNTNMDSFGADYRYVLLDQLFISKEWRGRGIGKKLFFMAAEEAGRLGAEKFYICAGSSEETVAFYRRIGCVDAMEINQFLYEQDPRDLQMEYTL